MQGFRQPAYLGVGMTAKDKLETDKSSLIAKIGAPFLKFINWLAKGQEGNVPCAG